MWFLQKFQFKSIQVYVVLCNLLGYSYSLLPLGESLHFVIFLIAFRQVCEKFISSTVSPVWELSWLFNNSWQLVAFYFYFRIPTHWNPAAAEFKLSNFQIWKFDQSLFISEVIPIHFHHRWSSPSLDWAVPPSLIVDAVQVAAEWTDYTVV